MKQNKKCIKGLVAIMALVIIVSSTSMIVNANNNTNTVFNVSYNGDGSDYSIKARAKEDNTYTYIKLNSGAKFQFAAQAKKGINSGDWGDPFNYGYSTAWHTLDAGKSFYFPNNAHKKGYSATYLTMSSSDHMAHTYKGVWSPDNLSGFGEP